uniref:Chloroplast processing peptidase n=1 Tax=Anthurium amnicola TaxID=1678845 RepID=A0A1D1YFM8_9ARAE
MRFLRHCSLGLLTWMPCNEFLMSLPAVSSLFRLNRRAVEARRDGRSNDSSWAFLNWWPSIDSVKLFLALLLISAMFAEIRCIVSSSMCPTLQPGDRVVIEKISYYFRNPSINDIITFRGPESLQDFGYKKEDIFIKRIVAKAGDFVEVCQGVLFINGTARRENFIAEDPAYRVRAIVCLYCLTFSYLPLNFLLSCASSACP